MQSIPSVRHLSDCDLLEATERVAAAERHLTVELLVLLAELDARRLYLGQSCSSLFTYCTQVLHLSEHAAYHPIEVTRAARQFPVILDMLAEGALTLTTVALLRPHLTQQNHTVLLDAARHKSKRKVEHQVACLAPRPDERAMLRKLAPVLTESPAVTEKPAAVIPSSPIRVPSVVTPSRKSVACARVAPLSPARYLLRVTLTAEAHTQLRRAQDLMRHTIPNGDPAAVIAAGLDGAGRAA
jgi:hypothetical protein